MAKAKREDVGKSASRASSSRRAPKAKTQPAAEARVSKRRLAVPSKLPRAVRSSPAPSQVERLTAGTSSPTPASIQSPTAEEWPAYAPPAPDSAERKDRQRPAGLSSSPAFRELIGYPYVDLSGRKKGVYTTPTKLPLSNSAPLSAPLYGSLPPSIPQASMGMRFVISSQIPGYQPSKPLPGGSTAEGGQPWYLGYRGIQTSQFTRATSSKATGSEASGSPEYRPWYVVPHSPTDPRPALSVSDLRAMSMKPPSSLPPGHAGAISLWASANPSLAWSTDSTETRVRPNVSYLATDPRDSLPRQCYEYSLPGSSRRSRPWEKKNAGSRSYRPSTDGKVKSADSGSPPTDGKAKSSDSARPSGDQQ